MPEIHDAAKNGNLQEVVRLLNNGADVNAKDGVSDELNTAVAYIQIYTHAIASIQHNTRSYKKLIPPQKQYLYLSNSCIYLMAHTKWARIGLCTSYAKY
jgi:hypothetical protein